MSIYDATVEEIPDFVDEQGFALGIETEILFASSFGKKIEMKSPPERPKNDKMAEIR